MFCIYCGSKIEDNSIFCEFCGKKVQANAAPEPAVESAVEVAVEVAVAPAAQAASGPEVELPVADCAPTCDAAFQSQETMPVQVVQEVPAQVESVVEAGPAAAVEPAPADMPSPAPAPAAPAQAPLQPADAEPSPTFSAYRPAYAAAAPAAQQAGKSGNKKLVACIVAIVAVVAIGVILAAVLLGTNGQAARTEQDVQGVSAAQDDAGAEDSAAAADEALAAEIAAAAANDLADYLQADVAYYGVWVVFTDSQSDATSTAAELKSKGFPAYVVETSGWSNLCDRPAYGVTAGMFNGNITADAMLAALKSAGYSDAAAQFTGEPLAVAQEVTLTVYSATGEELTGTVRQDENGYVLADSSTREYTLAEISALGLTEAELCIAWNEPFARMGYHFKNPELDEYFSSCSWYVDTNWSGSLSGVAAQNNTLIRDYAGDTKWKSLAAS